MRRVDEFGDLQFSCALYQVTVWLCEVRGTVVREWVGHANGPQVWYHVRCLVNVFCAYFIMISLGHQLIESFLLMREVWGVTCFLWRHGRQAHASLEPLKLRLISFLDLSLIIKPTSGLLAILTFTLWLKLVPPLIMGEVLLCPAHIKILVDDSILNFRPDAKCLARELLHILVLGVLVWLAHEFLDRPMPQVYDSLFLCLSWFALSLELITDAMDSIQEVESLGQDSILLQFFDEEPAKHSLHEDGVLESMHSHRRVHQVVADLVGVWSFEAALALYLESQLHVHEQCNLARVDLEPAVVVLLLDDLSDAANGYVQQYLTNEHAHACAESLGVKEFINLKAATLAEILPLHLPLY